MAEIKPFGAMRFTEKAGELGELTCPPYDIISEEERKAFLAKNPYNIIRLELPKEGDDPYKVVGGLLREWAEDGILDCDQNPGLYIYEEQFTAYGKPYNIKGFLCRVRLEEWEKGVVLPHEETLSKAKTDRFNLMKTTGCNFSSVYSLYFDPDSSVFNKIDILSQNGADAEFKSADGITHKVWKVEDQGEIDSISAAFEDKKLYIADGHHRYETAVNYRNYLREQGVIVDENHPANFIMMFLIDMENPDLVVFPTHRIVHGIDGFDVASVLEGCGKYFDIEKSHEDKFQNALDSYAAQGKKAFAFAHEGGIDILVLRDLAVMSEIIPNGSEAYRGLDVNVLHLLILERLLGIDKESMASQKNLIYTRDAAEALDSVKSGKANCAFIINPTRVDEIADVAGAGEKMPQKSTYFYPKLITGHIMNRMLEIK